MPRSGLLRRVAVLTLVGISLGGCRDQVDRIREATRDETPRETYARALTEVGLGDAALTRSWLAAGESAVLSPEVVDAPYAETGWWQVSEAPALGIRVPARRGQRIDVVIEAPDSTGVFLDLLRVPDESERPPTPVAAAGPLERRLSFEPGYSADYVVRIQPELLRGGEYSIEVRVGGSLAFPVDERGMSAILSVFGDMRDGGARDHHGVDIFAPRGTPAIAAAAGEAYRVDLTSIGGKVVWIRLPGSDRARLYYAHLDSQVVRNGDWVEVGDTVGFVGNTGNARTTPPHLHFGVYRRGAEDPWPYLEPGRALVEPDVGPFRYGRGVRTRTSSELQVRPGASGSDSRTVAEGTPLEVLAVTAGWIRVRGPEGQVGYIREGDVIAEPDPTMAATRSETGRAPR